MVSNHLSLFLGLLRKQVRVVLVRDCLVCTRKSRMCCLNAPKSLYSNMPPTHACVDAVSKHEPTNREATMEGFQLTFAQ